ncbi:MAG: hypothetical protein ACXVUE_02100 [Solirubrobacteraceae bacterium]
MKTAVTCSGDVDAANEVWQVALGFDGLIGSAMQPAIGAAPFSNVIVPHGDPVALTAANKLTVWFVTRVAEDATSEVLLGPAT